MKKKKVFILSDGSESVQEMAEQIALLLKDSDVSVKKAAEFQGTDLLPADILFIGCEAPSPGTFSYIEDLFKHINLAGRYCGVFSSGSEPAIDYLKALLKDCDITVNPEPLLNSQNTAVWVKKTVTSSD